MVGNNSCDDVSQMDELGAVLMSLADSKRMIAGACVALLAGSALLGQQVQFQGSVPAGVASCTPVVLTLREVIGSRPTDQPRSATQ